MIGYAEVIYQEEPRGINILPNELSELSIASFPSSLPMGYMVKRYSGIKIFPLSTGRISISWFFYDEETVDRFGRPALKARVLIGEGREEHELFLLKDVELVMKVLGEPITDPGDMMKLVREEGLFFSDEKAMSFLSSIEPDFMGQVLATIYKAKKADIITRSIKQPLKSILAFMPIRLLKQISICTSWAHGEGAEDLILSTRPSQRKCPKIFWDAQRIEHGVRKKEINFMLDFLKKTGLLLRPSEKMRIIAYLMEFAELPEFFLNIYEKVKQMYEEALFLIELGKKINKVIEV
ncbi:hypothetical protein DRN63_05240 [Nanoarchaeota archaeon]|nr:MAG: hypothetical protein DRN63_05240 [Nanoarchaeota archaeon]